MADISLSAGIRANLLSLQQSSDLFDRTTQRLASGRKVNSAVDNPTNYFASINLTDRSEGLTARLDGMGQAVQQIKAADNGITTIRGFISAMKGVVNNALSNTDADGREALGKQFNELVVQISNTAKDSGYQGINLLERNETNTVQFSETFDDSTLDVRGFDVRGPGADGRGQVDASGNLETAAKTAFVSRASQAAVTATQAAITASTVSTASVAQSGFASTGATVTAPSNANLTLSFAGNGTGYTASGTGAAAVTLGVASATATQATQAAVTATRASLGTYGTAAVAIAIDTQDGDPIGIFGAGNGAGMIDWSGANYKEDLSALVSQIESFDGVIQTQASNLSQNLATITIREEFSTQLINTLNEGSDKLVLADLNEEGANLLALQTSNQLATQSLSLASQQSQQVLQLLG